MIIRCNECGKPLRTRMKQRYVYRESGLNSVVLTGVKTFVCPGCRNELVEIPNIVGLHQAIAGALARKPALLTPAEFRFVRKELRLTGKALARYLGTSNVNLSRWEAGDVPINPIADRLIRVLYAMKAVRSQRAIEPAKFLDGFLNLFDKLVSTKRPRPLPLEIPADRLAGDMATTTAR